MPRRSKKPGLAEINGVNLEAVKIILADVEKHGGEGSLAVQWARLWMQNHDAAAVAKAWQPPKEPTVEDFHKAETEEADDKAERKRLKAIDQRRQWWEKIEWKRSWRGNLWIKLPKRKGGWVIVVFCNSRQTWMVRILSPWPDRIAKLFELERVTSEREACRDAFDKLLIVEASITGDPRLLNRPRDYSE